VQKSIDKNALEMMEVIGCGLMRSFFQKSAQWESHGFREILPAGMNRD